MNTNEMLLFLDQRLKFSSLNSIKQAEIEQYLTGEKEELPDIAPYKTYIYYDLLNGIVGQFQSECKDMAKRAYRLLGTLYGDKLLDENRYRADVYKTYALVSMDEEFVLKDIKNRIHLNESWYTGFVKKTKEKLKGNRDKTANIVQAFYYYGDLLERELGQDKFCVSGSKKELLVQLTLEAFSLIWYEDHLQKREYYREKCEKHLYSFCKTIFNEDKLKQAEEECLLSDRSRELYYNVKEIPKQDAHAVTGKLMKEAILALSRCLLEYGTAFKDALKLCLCIMEPKESIEKLDESYQALCELELDLNLPIKTRIRLTASALFYYDFTKEGVRQAEQLKKYYKENKECFIECTKKQLFLATLDAFPMAGILLRENPHSELLKTAQDCYLVYLKKAADQKVFQINLDGKKAKNLTFLTEQDSLSDHLELCYNSFRAYQTFNRSGIWDILINTTVMVDYLPAAKHMYQLFLKFMVGDGYTRMGLLVYQVVQEGFVNQNTNLFEKIGKITNPSLIMNAYGLAGPDNHLEEYQIFMKQYPDCAREVFSQVLNRQDDTILSYIKVMYAPDGVIPQKDIAAVLDHKLKSVVNFMEEFLSDKEDDSREYVEAIARKGNKNAKDAAARLIKLWDEDKIMARLEQISGIEKLTELVDTLYVKTNRKRIPFIDQLNLGAIHINGKKELADPILIEYYLSEYMLLKEVHIIKSCEKVISFLNQQDVRQVLHDLYYHWIRNEADTKIKNILIPYAIHAGAGEITNLKNQIDSWTQNSRGALAAYAVTALALNGSDFALLLVDGISKKYKNKQVKQAAADSIEQAAAVLGISKEALGDKIIPNLGFSKQRERWFDYGTRKFKAVLTEKLELAVYDENNKKLKALPKPGAKDDKELAEECAAACKDLKKQLKTVIATEKARMEDAILTGRCWTTEQWEHLFIDNPIMNGFASGLIWTEIGANGTMLGTFRYMEDGSFNSEEEEEYKLSGDSLISLLHPLDAGRELLDLWKTQLEDYEIVQPVVQLDMPVYQFTEAEKEEKQITRFYGKQVYFGTICSIMEKYDWKKTSVIDAGGYEGYYYEDTSSGLGVQIQFEYLYIGMAADERVTMGPMEFYKSGTIRYGSYTYDEVTDNNRVEPKDVPAKLASFALMIGELMAQKAV